jgi:hypothetical protein
VIRLPFLCTSCVHWDGKTGCAAFKGSVPDAILAGASHFDPIDGDGGIIYTPREDGEQAFITYTSFWYTADTEA